MPGGEPIQMGANAPTEAADAPSKARSRRRPTSAAEAPQSAPQAQREGISGPTLEEMESDRAPRGQRSGARERYLRRCVPHVLGHVGGMIDQRVAGGIARVSPPIMLREMPAGVKLAHDGPLTLPDVAS